MKCMYRSHLLRVGLKRKVRESNSLETKFEIVVVDSIDTNDNDKFEFWEKIERKKIVSTKCK